MNKTVAARIRRNEKIEAAKAYYAAREALESSSTEALEMTLAAFPGACPARQAAQDILTGRKLAEKISASPIVIKEMRTA